MEIWQMGEMEYLEWRMGQAQWFMNTVGPDECAHDQAHYYKKKNTNKQKKRNVKNTPNIKHLNKNNLPPYIIKT